MAGKLGDLVVSLEANMAKFQADMNKSADITQQSMLKIAASSDQAQKALKMLEAQVASAKNAATSLGKGLILGAAAGMGIDAIKNKIFGVIESMAHLKELSEKTGTSVENLSKLSFFAKQSGTDIDMVSGAMVKLAKGMAGADNTSRGAGLALATLGLSAKDAAGNLKDPSAMFTEVAMKLAEYKNGAEKTALANALIKGSGAELLPMMKLMSEQGDIAAKVTTAQANAALQYERDLKKLEVQQNMVFKTVAMALLPTMSDFTNAMLDASKNTNVLNKSAKDLATDNSIGSWADSAAMGMARLVDVIIFIPKALSAVSSSFQVVINDIATVAKASVLLSPGAMTNALARGENPWTDLKNQLAERNKDLETANAKYSDLWNYDGSKMEKAMAARIASRGKGAAGGEGGPLKQLNYDSSGEDGRLAKEADKQAKEAAKLEKNTSAGRLKALDDGLAKEQSNIEFANKYMAELRAQDIVDLSTYNQYRQMSLQSGLAMLTKTYDKEIAEATRHYNELQKGSDKAAALTKINEIKAKKEKAIQDNLQDSAMLTLGLTAAQSDLNKSVKEWIIAQDQAASQFQFEISLYGKSAVEAAKLTAARRIYLGVEEEIRQEQKKSASPIDRTAFDAKRDASIARSNSLYDQADTKQRDPWANMAESVRKYGEEASNTGAQIGNAMTNSFKSAEDAFTSFTMTGKLDFKSLTSSILSDLARIQAKKAIAALIDMAIGSFGGISDAQVADSHSDGMARITAQLSGARAAGGPVSGGSSYLVGEKGPEIFKAPSSGTIIPNHALGSSGGIQINTSISLSDNGAASETSGGSNDKGRAIADLVNTKIKEVLVRETRQGGILWNQSVGGRT